MFVWASTGEHNRQHCLAALKINNNAAEISRLGRPYKYATNENGEEFYPEKPKPIKLKKFSCWK